MATINFPNSPTVGQQFTSGVKSWAWNGAAWDLLSISDAQVAAAQAAAVSAAASAATANQAVAFVDSNPVVKGSGDSTKQLKFEVDGFTTGTTRTVTVPNKNGTMAMLEDGGLTLVAGPISTPTGSSAIDLLNIFSAGNSGYDNYLIIADGVQPQVSSNADSLQIRVATGGSLDSNNAYVPLGNSATNSLSLGQVRGTDSLAGSMELRILNANSTTALKVLVGSMISATTSNSTVALTSLTGAYTALNSISGFRLYWSGGSNFVGQGVIRVYGYKNS